MLWLPLALVGRQGSFTLSGRLDPGTIYRDRMEVAWVLAPIVNQELRELVKAGAEFIQIDEPYYSGFPEDLAWGVNVINTLVEGVDAKISVHICYGNRYVRCS